MSNACAKDVKNWILIENARSVEKSCYESYRIVFSIILLKKYSYDTVLVVPLGLLYDATSAWNVYST
jgi:hypothetical protein